jgi:3-phosphoshikimate 1-carboxyvinyltransferase
VLHVKKARPLKPLHFNLNDTPDLFPVLACLCAFTSGECRLSGAAQLVHKESNRLQKTAELLQQAGVPHRVLRDGIVIRGQGLDFVPPAFAFDPDQDHRMAMAAAVFKGLNKKIKIKSPHVVNKSYPQFWKDIKVTP